MRYVFITTLFCLLNATFLFAFQLEKDTLIYFSEITYNSDLEKEVLKNHFLKNEENYFALFSIINPTLNTTALAQYRNIHEGILQKVGELKLEKKAPEKKVKSIYKNVHSNYLKKYELQNNFADIYINGYYNCVSATALYSMVFEKYNIPYTIKETPTHVYLVAYPQSNRVRVETTDPNSGFYAFSNVFKKQYIEQLKNVKLISEEEYYSKDINSLFDKYYFTEEDINILQLVGIQYANDAIYLIDENKFEEAFVQLEKAYLFYPAEKVKYLLMAMCAEVLSKSDYTQKNDINYLIKFSRMIEFDVSNDVILGEWARATNSLLIDKNRIDLYNQHYNSLISNIADSTLKIEIGFYYNFERGRILYNQGKYEQSLKFIEDAYELKPSNHDIEQLLVSNIAQTMRANTTEQTVNLLETYANKYAGINKNDNFNNMLIRGYLQQVIELFGLRKISEGLKYKNLFEKKYDQIENINIDHFAIGRAYSLIAVYYYRKGYTSKAKSIIDQGLKYSPNNFELLQRKQMIH